jgi:hypothetical protein
MSILSQFFPSGSSGQSTGSNITDGVATSFGGTGNQIPVDLLVIGGGGGGGGLPSAPLTATPNFACSIACSVVTGGGGVGRVMLYENAFVNTGVVYPITVGAGGATNSSGGTSCFGTIIAGGGANGAGVDPAGNPVAAGLLSYTWGGGGGGGGFNNVTAICPSNGGIYQICDQQTSGYFCPSRINSDCVTSGGGITTIPAGIAYLSGNGGCNCNCVPTVNPCVAKDNVGSAFTKWGLPAYISPNINGKGSGSNGYCGGNLAFCPLTFSGCPIANCVTNGSVGWSSCPAFRTPPASWPLGWAHNYFIGVCQPISTCFPLTAPFAPCIAEVQTVLCNNIPYFGGPSQVCLLTPCFGAFCDQRPGACPLCPGVPGFAPTFANTYWPSLSPSLINPTCNINTNKAFTYSIGAAAGTPANGSGGNGGVRIQPTVPITGNVSISADVCFCVRLTCRSPQFPNPGYYFPGSCVTCSLSYTCPYGVSFPGVCQSGGAGGSGSVWIIYPTDFAAATVTGNTPVPSPPSIRVYRWDGAGTIKFN